jgi:V8-like Glu-specific endopeptidase
VVAGKPSRPSGTTSISGATYTKRDLAAARTGKVFFTLGGSDYVCSGSVVDSAHDNLVLTAGHCLYGSGKYATNFLFSPGYDGKAAIKAPHGDWVAEPQDLRTTLGYERTEDLNYDVGFARVRGTGAETLASTVGEQGIGFPTVAGATALAMGYPAASPYDGTTLTYCSGAVTPDPYGMTTQGLVCNMTGGSSGGPWFRDVGSDGSGTAYSLNSYRYTSGKHANKMFGPQFGASVQSLYDAMSAAPAAATAPTGP